jgi:choline dehydrogenase-like flavoprotein
MVYSNVEAIKCETEKTSGGVSRMTSVVVRTQTGEFRKIRIRKAAVVAGGAIASSRFLMRSEVGGDGVGNGVSCNYAFPTLVEFEEIINAFDGVQITMFAAPESFEAVFETTYNPPGTYSISLPVYFRQHAEMMRAYTRATNFGVLVGSDPSGTVSRNRDLVFGRAIDWNQTKGEIERIKRSLVTLVRIAKGAGAKRIILPTRPALIIPLESDVEKTLSALNATLSDKRYFNFYTAHPQGGNMLASESHNDRVVNTDFRVRDCENLFVCDASVFPRGIRVNPQWTIMALASLAAKRIAEA